MRELKRENIHLVKRDLESSLWVPCFPFRKGTESGGSFDKMAELPKDEPPVSSAFFLINRQRLLKERR
jgi:hypothetical protein